ncbi:hypothetical protein D3C78_1725010 [compost metagenome]
MILSTGKPSTIYKGSRPPDAVPRPRIITVGAEPGASLAIMLTPDIFPCTD